MFLLFYTLIVIHYIGSGSGDLSVVFQNVIPLNSTAINMTWTVVSSGDSNSTNDGVIKLAIDVCGVSSGHFIALPEQNASSINVSKWFVVTDLNPDTVYHACLGSNWTSANNRTKLLQYPCILVRTFMPG
jgi:hypothetical protein